MSDDLCQCPECGRMHKPLGFGPPPEIIRRGSGKDCMWCRYGDSPLGPHCPIHDPEGARKWVRAEALEEAARCVDGNRYAFYTPEQHAAAIRSLKEKGA